jgi:hypothetical protein
MGRTSGPNATANVFGAGLVLLRKMMPGRIQGGMLVTGRVMAEHWALRLQLR